MSMPHSLQAERALLGCAMIDPAETIARAEQAQLRPDAFYHHAHRLVWEAMLELHHSGRSIDLVVLTEYLHAAGKLEAAGGPLALSQAAGEVATTAHADHLIEIIVSTAKLRTLICAATLTIEEASRADYTQAADTITAAEERVFAVTSALAIPAGLQIAALVHEMNESIKRRLDRAGALGGLSTGFIDLDQMTDGLHPGEMIVLAARPSMGKTSLALNIAEATLAPAHGTPGAVLIFSLEMTALQLVQRMVSSRAKVSLSRLYAGLATTEEMARMVHQSTKVEAMPLYIEDRSGLCITDVRAIARRHHARHPLSLVVIDYLQLMAPTDARANRESQVAEISRGCKAMAKELGVPCLVLSQLNRESERGERRPRLSDLRESGAIEQDADVVAMLARPREENGITPNFIELILAKQRNGPVGIIRLTFNGACTRFDNYAEAAADTQPPPKPAANRRAVAKAR